VTTLLTSQMFQDVAGCTAYSNGSPPHNQVPTVAPFIFDAAAGA